MIPTRSQCQALFKRYQLPSQKKIHVEAVTDLAIYLAREIKKNHPEISINMELLEAAALLHDIDKAIPKQVGERHPDAAVRVLRDLDMGEVAQIVSRHSLHHILDPKTAPQSLEEKLVYLADKMTKFEVIGIEHRFKLWYRENLPTEAISELDRALPLVRQLQKEIFALAHIADERALLAQMSTK